ncbi:hypothetical protein DOM21_08625 [Bacteriovorax stolpii]|uniref:hypothetical protein n=1 Tax=Bacteriovorax stolpii TaxID=960 RepID=UPI0011586BB9|nr:hypothetical protein [Bacteriovorax stolpii]QDK41513.1 hypothetical protein DOM21_08625 [Bacteriovorax stolpii]
MKNNFLLLTSLLILAACKPETTKLGGFTFNTPGGSPIKATTGTSMILVNPASSPGFVSTPTVQVSGVVSGETVQIYRDSSCSAIVGSRVASAATVSVTLSTLSVGTYSLYTRSTNQFESSTCSGPLLTYQYLGVAPKTATGMTLLSPASSPSTDSTPTIQLTGLLSGETANIYIDSACTLSYGSAVAVGTSATITTNPLAPGTHMFYSNSTNSLGTGSCSSALLMYEYTGVMPNTASMLSLYAPTITPNYSATPVILANGVANGDTVYLYTDSGCSSVVGSAYATSTSVQITVSALAVGTYGFYTNSANIIGTSACSSALVYYSYVGPAPSVEISWSANHEKAVNQAGGGYRVYYSRTSSFDVSTATYVDVPYAGGPLSPTSTVMTNLLKGSTFFKVVAYSSLNAPGSSSGSQSLPSVEFSVNLP